ncbi:MAG: prepilin-type N-terminal cleavage/methylation domain-containing protein [Verrucomicrobiae bacterium]|nr:prepilin-type N-terminal cleavage/methylation domain-containing protein [Verrucomicrobiae bacterium]MCB1086201.1 prepilin-type N-terminal cleavage/methylation domain-containing protein [Verrucomicrobiae bacterium]
MLVVLAVIGIMAMLAIPAISGVSEASKDAKAQRNAQSIAQVSSALGALGVAHVLPDSMGGVEATARLLREGVTVSRGPFQGSQYIIAALSDEEIEYASKYLNIVYDLNEIRLTYAGPSVS